MNVEPYITKDGKQLRLGYTTGSCAAAAAKAAAWMLLSGNLRESISLQTPKGIRLELPVLEIFRATDRVSCAIRKDSGDDPDITDGALIFASVSRHSEPGIIIDGEKGVGRVTKPGLDQPVGAAAINSVPRHMIRENLEEVCETFDYRDGLSVIISVPEGEKLAEKTFNPRLGIIGGISILGTSGIVEPMSDQALIDTIRLELKQRRINGADTILLTPGNYGMDFLTGELGIDPNLPVMTSNFIGDALDACKEFGFRNALLVGHIGKLVKIAGGMLNTHSRYGDCRMEILASYAGACGLHPSLIKEMLGCVTCDEALRILKSCNLDKAVLSLLSDRISFHLNHRTAGQPEVESIVFSKVHGLLCETQNAKSFLHFLREEK
ncbi:MAG: cobalamin biosynthesis protein CbiD [Flexilinea sp.]|nr:cobalamin biosynthesis protein CbiD [Flexilinea sp.]